ncbi:uncharacterized protein LOC120349423 [Nilaparvata lugens]|uniref:uncharacterized protein LOC120349423 n=1 Tax=Nilaparvata lugens TaxID=108931 RepID=UPI00193EAF6F|nr:uncharacterized protein LOC120349423 [Nilaparvata lugens]
MIRLPNQILFFVCILKITIGHPTRVPQIIKDEEKVTFQNKLPEDPLDSEITVVGKPLNTTKHGFGQLKNNGSIIREKEKHHCPFCQYSANTEENRDLDSESPQPYLILGNIKPVVNQPTIITQKENHEDNNSTWSPQNQIKAILKIPEGNGKEHKRCTHGDNGLGGGLQHTEFDNILLNNPDILKNIDFSCCSTLRRILLNALRLEGKCLCSDSIATSPIINITALKDNAFEEGLVRQEVQPILIKQQLDTSSKILGQEEGLENNSQGNLIYDRLMFKEPNGENHLIDSLGMRNTGENIEENNDRKHGMIDSSGKQDAMGNIGSIKNKASDLIVNLGMKNTEIGNDENNSKENDDMITTVMQSTRDNIKEGENGENVMKTSGMQNKKDSISENKNRGSHGNNTLLIQNMRDNVIGSVNGEDGVLNTLGSRNEKENKSGENEVITTSVMQNTMNSIDGNSNKDKGVMNTLVIQNTRENIEENHNEENGELNTSGVPDKKYDTTKFGSEMGVMTIHSNGSKDAENSKVTSQLPFEKPGRFMGSNINVKPMMIDSGEEVGAPSINDSLIIGNKRQIEEDLKLVEESVMGNTKKFSTIETVELSTTSLGISDSSTTEPNEKLEEIEGYLGKPGTKVNYKSTENTSNQLMDLFVGNRMDNSLKKVLDGKHKNEENLSDLDEGINEYTTENLLRHIDENGIINFNEVTNNTTKNVLHKILGLESKELKLRNISDNLLEMNMKFSNGTTQSTQELTKVMEMESYITTPKESDLEKKANYTGTDDNLLITPENEQVLLQPNSEIQAIKDGKLILERKKILSKSAENQSFTAENRSKNLTIESYTENTWTEDKLMSTLTYNLGQQLGVDDDKLLEQTTPEHSTQNGIIFTTGYSEISTIGTEISEEPSEVDDLNKIKYQKKVLSGIPNYSHSENEESGPLELQKENGNLLKEFYDKKSKENQDQAEETAIVDEFSTENSTDTSIENSDHMLLLPSQNGSTVQLNRSKEAVTDIQSTQSSPDVTRDPIASFEVNSLTTTEPILLELRSSTLSSEAKSLTSDSKELRNSSSDFEVNLLTTESILQETKSPEVFLDNGIPTMNTEKSLNNYVTDFLMNNQQFSSPDYLPSTESSVQKIQSTDNLSKDGSPNLSTVKLSDINSNDSNTNRKPEKAQSIDNQTQNGEDIQRLDPDNSENYTLGSILKPTTDGLQESEDFNLATTSSNIKLDIPLKNNQPEDPRKMNGDPKRLENGRDVVMEASLEPDNYMLGSIETGSTQPQSTDSPLKDDILNQTSSPFHIELEKRKKIDYQLRNGQDILSKTSLQPDKNPIDSTQTNEGESSTLSTDLESNSNDLYTNNGAIATTPTEASLLSQFDEMKTYQNPLNMTSSNDTIRKDLLLSTNVNRVSQWNGTEIDIEMEKAENILKTLIDGFKKTHFDDNYDNIVDEVTDNPEKAVLETSTHFLRFQETSIDWNHLEITMRVQEIYKLIKMLEKIRTISN